MQRMKNAGFSLMEIMVVLLIIAIIGAIAVPGVMYYVRHARQVKQDNTARTIFVAIQSQLSSMKNSGTLGELATFEWVDGIPQLCGGLLFEEETGCGSLSPTVYYMLVSKEGDDSAFLQALLEQVDLSHEVGQGSISVEFDATTCHVTAVFYSDVYAAFEYRSGSETDLSMEENRVSTYQRGVYVRR